jgi:transcriptional regulator with XRE-family HTH domain
VTIRPKGADFRIEGGPRMKSEHADMQGLRELTSVEPIGGLLRAWRRRRRMSQFDLACAAAISTKHLSFLETGRSRPSRDMVRHLAERLDVPLRARNVLLAVAGFEPEFPQRDFNDPALAFARGDIELVLAANDPNPAMALDRHWLILSANKAVRNLVVGAEPILLRPPVNLLRLCLHPAGLASRIVNLMEWRARIIARLRRQIDSSGDTGLMDLLEEISDYPRPPGAGAGPSWAPCSGLRRTRGVDGVEDVTGIAIPFQLVTIDGTLSFSAPRHALACQRRNAIQAQTQQHADSLTEDRRLVASV